jgi:hypothetical protein
MAQVQLASVQNSGQFVDSGAGKVRAHQQRLLSPFALSTFLISFLRLHLCKSRPFQVQERSMAADSERAYEAFVSHQMGGGAPPK